MPPTSAIPAEASATSQRGVLFAFAIAIALLVAAAWAGYRQSVRTVQGYEWVGHTLLVRQRATELDADLLSMEAQHRGYLLLGRSDLLQSRDAYLVQAAHSLEELRQLTRDNPQQQQRLREIGELLQAREARMRATTARAQSEGLEAARAHFNPNDHGSIKPLHEAIVRLRDAEAELFAPRSRAATAEAERLRWQLLLAPVLASVLLCLVVFALIVQLRRSQRMQTQIRQAGIETELARAELDRFFTLSLDMLCISSADGYFKRLSPAFTRTLGWSIEEMLTTPFIEFVHPDDREATMAEVERQVKAGQQVLQFENRYRHKDGSWRILSWKSAPRADGLMYATARDVTEKRLAEQRIVALNRDLEARQIELEAANRDLEAFSYSVSHDLRAPLRHVHGYARMLSEDAGERLDGDLRRYVDAIGASAERMGRLIDDLLSLSRLGRKPLEKQRIDMRAMVEEVIAELRADRSRFVVGDLPAAAGDPVLLRQLWTNLLSNAVKYSEPRGDAARIEVEATTHAGSIAYRVRDNGVGFDMRYADKLFGVFQRLHAQDRFEGTGVGLAISQRVVHRHGGNIRAKAQPGLGAEFEFDLPPTGPSDDGLSER
ncbi:ATP-binding protein [Arenimonas sp.]|uniref:sensor histidine kinase n=1 Tax=Arenimonas sp. TaxID=1872635 RepID=UPI0039E55EA7